MVAMMYVLQVNENSNRSGKMSVLTRYVVLVRVCTLVGSKTICNSTHYSYGVKLLWQQHFGMVS